MPDTSNQTRYTRSAFPPYRYQPGKHPHPVRDPLGHSHGLVAEPEELDAEEWAGCASYLRAIDLFNHRYYWEAHEELEGLWKAAGRRSETGIFLQGLIQLAASLLKCSMGEWNSAGRLAKQAGIKLCRG